MVCKSGPSSPRLAGPHSFSVAVAGSRGFIALLTRRLGSARADRILGPRFAFTLVLPGCPSPAPPRGGTRARLVPAGRHPRGRPARTGSLLTDAGAAQGSRNPRGRSPRSQPVGPSRLALPWEPVSMRKRELVRRALSAVGVTAARWRLLPTRLYCFNYHRVGDPLSTDFNRNIFSCSAERFEEHVRCVRDRFEVVTLDGLRHIAEHGHAGRRPPALITFDDGYVDTYTAAFPVLRRYQVPAIFFLPTAYFGSSAVPMAAGIVWLPR